MRLCFASNLAMLFPIYIAYAHDSPHLVVSLIVCMLFSMCYHLDEANEMGLLVDVAGVIILVATCVFTFMRATFVLTPINLLAAVYVTAALYCYFAAGTDATTAVYNEYHSAWHALAAFAIAAYIYSHEHTQLMEANPSRIARPFLVQEEADHFESEVALLKRWCRARVYRVWQTRGETKAPPAIHPTGPAAVAGRRALLLANKCRSG